MTLPLMRQCVDTKYTYFTFPLFQPPSPSSTTPTKSVHLYPLNILYTRACTAHTHNYSAYGFYTHTHAFVTYCNYILFNALRFPRTYYSHFACINNYLLNQQEMVSLHRSRSLCLYVYLYEARVATSFGTPAIFQFKYDIIFSLGIFSLKSRHVH